jgi:hypothetical protein
VLSLLVKRTNDLIFCGSARHGRGRRGLDLRRTRGKGERDLRLAVHNIESWNIVIYEVRVRELLHVLHHG